MKRFVSLLVPAASLLVMLAACAIPYSFTPGFRASRSNLGNDVPAFIVAGQTTREEVLRALGTPEVEALDSAWFYYESDYLEHSSGLVLFTGGPGAAVPVGATGSEAQLHRRLFVRFNAKGEVASTEFKSQRCVSDSSTSKPGCEILKRGAELREERRSALLDAAAAATGDQNVARFDSALWNDGAGLPSMWANLRDDPLSCSWARRNYGSLLLSDSMIVFVPVERTNAGAGPGFRAIARARISKTELFGPSLINVYTTAGLQVTLTNGAQVSFTVCGPRGDPAMNELKAIQALLERPALQ